MYKRQVSHNVCYIDKDTKKGVKANHSRDNLPVRPEGHTKSVEAQESVMANVESHNVRLSHTMSGVTQCQTLFLFLLIFACFC